MTTTKTSKTSTKTATKAAAKKASAKKASPKKVAASLQSRPMSETVAVIKNAKEFTTYVVAKGIKLFNSYPTLLEAAKAADSLQKTHKKGVLLSAIDADKKATTISEGVWRTALNSNPKAPKAQPKPDSEKPAGKRAAILAAAQAGTLPPVPDFSAETHKRFRPKLEQVVAMVKAGDVKGLKAFEINPVSSSPKAIDKYRNLAVIALEAKGKAA